MGSLKRRLDQLEIEAGQHQEILVLPDGTTVRYSPEEATAAFSAAVDGREHGLIQPFVAAETTRGFPGLVRALILSQELVEERG